MAGFPCSISNGEKITSHFDFQNPRQERVFKNNPGSREYFFFDP